MQIKKVVFKNLCSYGKKPTVIDFSKAGKLTGVIAKNGQGKTSAFLDSIFFAFFGEAFRKINKPELVNRTNGKELEVEVYFNNFSHEWIIRRGIKPNFIEVWKDGSMVNLDAHSNDIQRYIEKNVIGINDTLFKQLFMLNVGSFKSFFNLKAKERRELFEEVVRINVLTMMRKRIKGNENNFAAKLSEVKITIQSYQREKLRFEQQISEVSKSSNVDNSKEIEHLSSELESINATISSLQSKLDGIDMDVLSDELETKVNAKFAKEKQFSLLEKDFNDIKSLIEFFKNNDNCPTCQQKITERIKEEKISEKKIELRSLVSQLTSLEQDINAKADEISTINGQIAKYNLFNKEYNTLSATFKHKTIELESFRKSLNNDKTKAQDFVDLINKQISTVEQHMAEYMDKLEAVSNMIRINDVMKFLLSDDGIKNYIYQRFTPLLTNFVNENLAQFESSVKFKLSNELQEEFYYRVGESLSYASFSGGERMILDLSFILGFQKFLEQVYNFHSDIIIVDEIFDSSIDGDNADKILLYMKYKSQKKFVIISHGAFYKESYDTTYYIKKISDFSYISTEPG